MSGKLCGLNEIVYTLSVDLSNKVVTEANNVVGVIVKEARLKDYVVQSQSASATNPQNTKSLFKDCYSAMI